MIWYAYDPSMSPITPFKILTFAGFRLIVVLFADF